jgi:hypothetical protein
MSDTISLFLRRKSDGEIVLEMDIATVNYRHYKDHLSRRMGRHYFVDTTPSLYFLERWDNRQD